MVEVSVIIPIYNKGYYAKKSIESVLNQNFQNFELIILNDGSTDNTKEVLNEYIELPQVRYYEHENKGVSYTRNRGIKLAKGNYITFLDADDTYEPTFLEEMCKSFYSSDEEVKCCLHNIDGRRKRSSGRYELLNSEIFLLQYILGTKSIHINSWLIKKNIISENNLTFDEDLNWGEDMLFFINLMLKVKRVKVIHKFLTNYNTGIDNALSSNDINKIEKEILWIKKATESIQEKNFEKLKIKSNIIDSLECYRLPALIVYRLDMNKKELGKKEIKEKKECYQPYLKKVKFNNGFRSIKLFYKYFTL